MTAREFDRSLREIAKPALESHGFEYQGKRRFVKRQSAEEQIIHFQLGVRSLQGRFTVNLKRGEREERLGKVRSNAWTRILNRALGSSDPWWKAVLLPKDRWWKLSGDQGAMFRTMRACVRLIEQHGLAWLNRPPEP